MSTIPTADVKERSEARLADRLVLLELADEAGHDGWVLISVKTIAKHTLLGVRSIVRSLAALEQAGEIECRSGGGSGQSSAYRVLLSEKRPKGEPLPERITRVGRACQVGTPPRNKNLSSLAGGACQVGRGGMPSWQGSIEEESAPGTAPGTAPIAPDGAAAVPAAAVPSLKEPVRSLDLVPVEAARRDLLFEAVFEAWTGSPYDPATVTKQARGYVNAVLPELRELHASPDEVRWKARIYRANDPSGKRPTPSALVKHWPALTSATLERVDRRQLDRELAARQSEAALRQALGGAG